jgi:hypothetical protein
MFQKRQKSAAGFEPSHHPIPLDRLSQFWVLFGFRQNRRPDGRAMDHWQRAKSELRRRVIERLAAASASSNPPAAQGIS